MTEKRFVDYFDTDHNYIIQDLQNEDEYQVGFVNCDEDVFLKLVNELAEENEQLRKENDMLSCELSVSANKEISRNCRIAELEEENEQLKKENYELHKRLGEFEPFEEHMKERTSKTSVNYIVGLVKTDESTDIVELKRD